MINCVVEHFSQLIISNVRTHKGIEDYMGDMDMKIAGTKDGITAIQADIKTCGIPLKVVNEALDKAYGARAKIIDIMSTCLSKHRVEKKECWPVTEKMTIEPHQRSRLVGPGGIHIKKIFLDTGVQLTQEDENSYTIFAPSKAAMEEAKEYIGELLSVENVPELEFGGIYTAKIVEIKDTGVMLTLFSNMPPAFLHISQLDIRKVRHELLIMNEWWMTVASILHSIQFLLFFCRLPIHRLSV